MKKIFAIALALVMVLSMASAFASYCTGGFDWTCATSTKYCGQGTVEVVPYVKVNNGCGGFKWEVSECASAVSSEDVFYAVKLTVDANADSEWWNTVEITTSYKGMDLAANASLKLFDKAASWTAVKALITAEDTEAVANTFYYDFVSKSWDIVNSTFELANSNVDNVPVKDASKAKVCVKLTAENNFTEGVVGNYYVKYVKGVDAVTAAPAKIVATITGNVVAKVNQPTAWDVTYAYDSVSNKTVATATAKKDVAAMTVDEMKTVFYGGFESAENYVFTPAVAAVTAVANQLLVLDKKDGKVLVTYTIVDGKVREIKHSNVCGADTYETIKAFFGLEIGTCVDDKIIKANFGWKDKVEDCFAWGDKAPYVVDAECVVAIPKTGDKSVLAWLF